ncbi:MULTISPECIES: ClbS/DfsB family four-helix bundle protein [unclassified Roseitalea]|uniref:ClbS/DfsB family four-helix bundle protein n=1 Tax=unclassified Roseitalea TaxID=2639107 RepID=UPI00273F94D4|nr:MULTISPECIES: ClbS/DfsB family four-helix bundle protein [unclassified Roseitalea]
MPAATSQHELLTVFDKEHARLTRTLDGITEAKSMLSAPGETATIKGVIAHRTHWIGLFFAWVEASRAGKPVQTPAPGVKWTQLKAYNAPIYEDANRCDWAVLRTAFEAQAMRLRAFIAANGDEVLYVAGLYPWMNKWTLGRWAEASGPSHFRSANTYIRKVLREAGRT